MWWEWYCVICETVPWEALQLITCFPKSLPRVPVPGLTTLSLPCCESLRPMETPCIGAKPSNESKWALSGFQLCRVAPSLQIFPAGVQTWRSRVKLFILCPVWILDRRIFEFNEMAVLKCPAKFEGDLLHSNSSYNRKLEPNLSQISDKELKSGFFLFVFYGSGAKHKHFPQVDMLFPSDSSNPGAWMRNSASYYTDAQGHPRKS